MRFWNAMLRAQCRGCAWLPTRSSNLASCPPCRGAGAAAFLPALPSLWHRLVPLPHRRIPGHLDHCVSPGRAVRAIPTARAHMRPVNPASRACFCRQSHCLNLPPPPPLGPLQVRPVPELDAPAGAGPAAAEPTQQVGGGTVVWRPGGAAAHPGHRHAGRRCVWQGDVEPAAMLSTAAAWPMVRYACQRLSTPTPHSRTAPHR